ncbi:MAG: IPT/TIG domain-containing protein [Bacteroidales bacterium]|jgi:hypothetical protein|nr:IPT/TIG domain-containing protein [Bacteroidales bacterium]
MKNKRYVKISFAAVLAFFAITFFSCKDEDKSITGIVPEATSITPVENLRAGNIITVKGKNLDQVKEVRFGESYLIAAANFVSLSATEIQIEIPAAAPGGEVYLVAKDDVVPNQLAGNITMLMPVITKVEPAEIEIGGEVSVTGTDLDLITSITVNKTELEILETTAALMRVKFPDNLATGGLMTFVKENKEETVYGTPISILLPVDFPEIVSATPDPIKIGQLLTIAGANLDQITQVFFGQIEATQFGTRNASMIEVTVPEGVAMGACEIKFVIESGVEFTHTVTITSGAPEITVFQGPLDLTWDTGGRAVVPASAFANVSAGAVLKIYFTQNENWGQAQINDGGWAQIPWPELGGAGTISSDTYGDKAATSQEFILTQEILTLLDSKKGIFGDYSETEPVAIIIQGSDWRIDKITITGTSAGGTGVDPVDDPEYVFFDFNDGTKNSWWGQVNVNNAVGSLWEGVENDSSLSLDGTPYARVNNGGGMFFRNGANNLKTDGVTLSGWVVKLDVRVISGSGAIRLELQSGGTQYMAVVNLEDKGGWYTATVPFSDFKDEWGSGSNSLPDLVINEFGATDGGEGETMTLLIDNVRFEPK